MCCCAVFLLAVSFSFTIKELLIETNIEQYRAVVKEKERERERTGAFVFKRRVVIRGEDENLIGLDWAQQRAFIRDPSDTPPYREVQKWEESFKTTARQRCHWPPISALIHN